MDHRPDPARRAVRTRGGDRHQEEGRGQSGRRPRGQGHQGLGEETWKGAQGGCRHHEFRMVNDLLNHSLFSYWVQGRAGSALGSPAHFGLWQLDNHSDHQIPSGLTI